MPKSRSIKKLIGSPSKWKAKDREIIEVIEEIKLDFGSPKRSVRFQEEKLVSMYNLVGLITHFEQKFDIDLQDSDLDVLLFYSSPNNANSGTNRYSHSSKRTVCPTKSAFYLVRRRHLGFWRCWVCFITKMSFTMRLSWIIWGYWSRRVMCLRGVKRFWLWRVRGRMRWRRIGIRMRRVVGWRSIRSGSMWRWIGIELLRIIRRTEFYSNHSFPPLTPKSKLVRPKWISSKSNTQSLFKPLETYSTSAYTKTSMNSKRIWTPCSATNEPTSQNNPNFSKSSLQSNHDLTRLKLKYSYSWSPALLTPWSYR